MKILLVEDEEELQNVIRKSLEKQSYIVETATNYQQGIDKITVYDYDCILLDIMLPDGTGLDLLREIKHLKKKEAIIIISAKDSLDDKIVGLDLGADDYLTKPFYLAELHARIKSAVRRRNQEGELEIVWNNVSFSPENRTVKVNNTLLNLNRKEIDLLYYFIINPNKLITKTAIAEYVWGDHADQLDSFDFIYSQIKNLRKKLKEVGAETDIQAVYGIGYKLVKL